MKDMKISLVIPLKNEEKSVESLLNSISGQIRLPDEVVIVDAGSEDATKKLVSGYKDSKLNIRLVLSEAVYPGVARNIGVKNALHDWIAFTDGGIILDGRWLYELSRTAESDPFPEVVYGNYAPKADTLFKECLSIAFVAPPSAAGCGMARPRFIASSLLKKAVFEKTGGFPDYRAAEDRIFMESVDRGGVVTARCPEAMVTWNIPEDIKKTFARFSNYSFHDIIAGRTSDWHMPVVRMYVAASVFILLGVFVTPVFLPVPIAGLALRAAQKISANRRERFFSVKYLAAYAVIVPFLIVVIDMAMFYGMIKYMLSRSAAANEVRR